MLEMIGVALGGPKGETKASVSATFNRRQKELREDAAILHNALQGKHHREWQTTYADDGTLLDPAELGKVAFDRTDLNTQYSQATNSAENAGTTADIIAIKLQIDYMAMEERAYRARHCSLPRSIALAHGRRFGQAHGPLFSDSPGGLINAVTGYIAAGSPTRQD